MPTGRLAFTDPNLQSITHKFDFVPVKGDTGESQNIFADVLSPTGTPVTINIRDAFIPAKGFTFLAADYSQLEFRLMAHYSKYEKFFFSRHVTFFEFFCLLVPLMFTTCVWFFNNMYPTTCTEILFSRDFFCETFYHFGYTREFVFFHDPWSYFLCETFYHFGFTREFVFFF